MSRIAALEALPSLPDRRSQEFEKLPVNDQLRAVYGAALKNVPAFLAGEPQGWGPECAALVRRIAGRFAVAGAQTEPLASLWGFLQPLLTAAVLHGASPNHHLKTETAS